MKRRFAETKIRAELKILRDPDVACCRQLLSAANLAPIRVLFLDQVIESDLAGSEDQNHQSEREVDKRVRIVELGRIREERGRASRSDVM